MKEEIKIYIFTVDLIVSTVHVVFKLVPKLCLHAPYKLSFSEFMVWILNPIYSQILSAISSVVPSYKIIDLLVTISVVLYSFMDIYGMS